MKSINLSYLEICHLHPLLKMLDGLEPSVRFKSALVFLANFNSRLNPFGASFWFTIAGGCCAFPHSQLSASLVVSSRSI
ncbi:hypothetical protein Hanom_Chr09g00804561 [Helianthus anomalus]